jgi:hypothetical protein
MKVSIFCLVILTAAISLSCKKETVTEYRYKDLNTWKKADEIDGFSKYINNANASNDKAVFVSPYRVIIKKENKVEAYYSVHSHTKKTDIADDYHLLYNKNGDWENLGVASEDDPNPARVNFQIRDLSNFSGMGGIFSSSEWTAIRTDQKQFIFQYYGTDLDTQHFALVDFEENGLGIKITDFNTVSKYKNAAAYRIRTKSFFNKYFICFGPGLEIIDSSGNVRQTSGLPLDKGFFDIVLKGDSLIAFAYQSIYFSIDEGENWNAISTNIPQSIYDVYDYSYYVLENEIIAFRTDQLIHIQFLPTEITLRPIISDALINNRITSIFEYRDTVYVSTLSGTFKKPLVEFFEYVQ